MAKKRKSKVEVIEQSAVRVTLTIDFPVTEGSEVNDIRKLATGDIYTLIGNYFYRDVKSKTELVTIKQDVPAQIINA